MQSQSKDILYALLVVIVWSTDYIVKKFLVLTLPPYLIVSIQCLFISMILLPFCRKPPINIKVLSFISFLWGPVCYSSMMLSLKLGLDIQIASIIAKSNIIFTIMFAIIFLKEKINLKILIGLMITTIGALVILSTNITKYNIYALFFILVYAISSSGYYCSLKYYKIEKTLSMVCWVALLTLPQTIIISLIFEGYDKIKFITIQEIFCIIYLAFAGKIVGLTLWSKVIARNESYKILPFSLMIPFVTSLMSYIIFDEKISTINILSAIIIFIGIIIINIKTKND